LNKGFSSFEDFKNWVYSEDKKKEKTTKFKAYALQFNIKVDNFKENFRVVAKYISSVEENSLILLPELFSTGFLESKDSMWQLGLITIQYLKENLAKVSEKKNLTIVGTIPYLDKEKLFNRVFVIDNGVLKFYRDKYYLFKLTGEDLMFTRGIRDFKAIDTSKGRIGVMICYELRFPDIAWEFFKQKIDILLVPAEWGKKRKEHLKCLSKARAIEQRAFVIVANATGLVGDIEMAGNSGIYSPWGEELAFIDEEEGLISADIDLKEVEKVERYFKGRD
jgi:predicted amidohydrolase